MSAIHLIPIIDVDVETQLKVLAIRNQISVRSMMYTDHEIGVNEHLAWIASLKKDPSKLVFCIMLDNVPQGVVSLNAINQLHKTADWAFYLSETSPPGIAPAIEYALIDFAFNRYGLEKLNCEVLDINGAVVKLHNKFGFANEGFKRENIVKGGVRIGVHYLGLTLDDWKAASPKERYAKAIDKHQVLIHWEPHELPAIDKIEQARARNNVNWMSILRLAIEKSPDVAIPIVSEIRELDEKIIGMTHELIDKQTKS